MGGVSAVVDRARSALAAKEYAWAAQLAGYLFRIAPSDPAIRRSFEAIQANADKEKRPLTDEEAAAIVAGDRESAQRDLYEAITDAVDELARLGLRRTFQHNAFFGELSLLENAAASMLRKNGSMS